MEIKSDTYVIILAAGYATRLKPLSNKIPKPLLDINGETLISRIISNFKISGFSRFCVLVGYMKERVMEEVSKINDIEVLFVEQKQMVGMADGISLCIKYINKSEKTITNFFVSAVDIVFSQEKILNMYLLHLNSDADMVLSLMKSDDVEIAKSHGNVKILIDLDKEDYNIYQELKIIDVIEKPEPHQILSEYYSLPLYIFNQKIGKYLEHIQFSERGEKEFQDVIKQAIINGEKIIGLTIIDTVINRETIGKYHVTNLYDLIKMNNRFLSGVNLKKFKGKSPQFFEPVNINLGVEMGNNVSLGPYAIIGNNCMIGDFCELSDVIVFNNAIIGRFCKLEWCIVDEDVILPEKFHAKKCFISKRENNASELEVINF